jgi:hypothetical protein
MKPGVALLVAAMAPGPSFASDTRGARAFLEEIYGQYVGKDARGVALADRARWERYFTASLAKAMAADSEAAAKRGEVGTLDGDPFLDAQDWELTSFTVDVQEKDASHVLGIVRFTNLGTSKKVELSLVRLPNGWRVEDISWGQRSLREMFTMGAPTSSPDAGRPKR